MSDNDDNTHRKKHKRRKNSNFKPESVGDYAVGYGKPPEDGRIRPGETREGAGRPKGAKNKPLPERLSAKILRDGSSPIKVKNGKTHDKMEAVEAAIRVLRDTALKGNQRALQYYLDLQLAADLEHRKDNDAGFETALLYQKHWSEKIAEAEESGYEPPRPVPHPDDMHFDFETRTVRVEGPINEEGAARHRVLMATMRISEYEISVFMSDLVAETEPRLRNVIFECLQHAYDIMVAARKGLSFPWTTEAPPEVDYALFQSLRKTAK